MLKTRTDCIVGIPNITQWCEDILQEENKRLLLTQQTGDGVVGDCFMYGDIDIMDKVWHESNPVHHPDGLINTAYHLRQLFPDGDWKEMLQEIAAFRDVVDIEFGCLRWNYSRLPEIFDADFDVNSIHWGKANNWHRFSDAGQMVINCNPKFWSKKDFYG